MEKRRKIHECIQEENIGMFKEFIESTKGMRPTITAVVLAILIQVGSFLYLWGDLTRIVKQHDKDIGRIVGRLDKVHLVGYVFANNGNGIKLEGKEENSEKVRP